MKRIIMALALAAGALAGQAQLNQAALPEQQAYQEASAQVAADPQLAAQLFQEFLAQYPASEHRFEALAQLGNCYYGTDYAKALAYYAEVDPRYLSQPQAAHLLYHRAYCLLQLGRYDDAAADFAQLAGNPQYAALAQFYRGYIAYMQGKYADAVARLEPLAGIAAQPMSSSNYYLSQIYYMQGQYQKAFATAKALLKSPDANPEFVAEANRVAGESALHLADRQQAKKYLQAYQQAMGDAELQPSASYALGILAYDDADYRSAVEHLKHAAAIGDAMSQSANLYIGQALLKLGDTDGAILAFDNALNMDFDPEVQETAYYNYAVASLQGAKVPFGNSVSTFENFLRRYPESQYAPEAQKYIVAAYLGSGNYAAALESINSMARPTADTQRAKQRALYMLGAQSLAAGNAPQAINYLTEAQTLASHDAEVALESALLLGEAYYKAGKYADAATELQRYLADAPAAAANRPLAFFDLGYTRFAQKKYADAATDFKRMLANPGTLGSETKANAYARLGDCYYYQRKFADAAKAYDESYNLNRSTGDYALLQKALMEGYQRHHRQKIELIDALQAQYPNSALIPDALLEQTESYIQLGDNQGAIDVYKQLVDRYPNTAQGRQGYLQMALTMLNDGQRAGAIDTYRQVITKFPTSDEASQAAEQLKRLYAADGALGEYMAFINNVPNAPKMEASEADNLTFEMAEKAYITADNAEHLEQYIIEYPQGAHRAKALSYLVEKYTLAGADQQAYKHACALAADYPDNALALDALAAKARIEYAEGKGVLALATWQLLEQKASSASLLNTARMGIARSALDTDSYAEAIRASEAALASGALGENDLAEAWYIKGAALDSQGNAEAARAAWTEGAKHPAAYHGMACAYALAESTFDSSDLARAEELAKAVTDADTPHQYWTARGFILLSDIYAAQGNEYKAQQYLKSLKDNYPGTEADIFTMINQRIK